MSVTSEPPGIRTSKAPSSNTGLVVRINNAAVTKAGYSWCMAVKLTQRAHFNNSDGLLHIIMTPCQAHLRAVIQTMGHMQLFFVPRMQCHLEASSKFVYCTAVSVSRFNQQRMTQM